MGNAPINRQLNVLLIDYATIWFGFDCFKANLNKCMHTQTAERMEWNYLETTTKVLQVQQVTQINV